MKPKTVLFACVHNAGRSQMAAAFFSEVADPAKARGLSAGTQPAEHVHPAVVQVMSEVGIDLAANKPQALSARLQGETDFLVTMGCGESCPLIPAVRRVDWQLPDPKGQAIERVREIRDTIRERVRAFVEEKGWGR